MRLKNKVCIITGGGSGIGKGIALAYAREGADIIIADVNAAGAEETAAGVRASGRKALVIATDVSRPAEVEALMAGTLKVFGRLDVLVNVAGVIKAYPILETTEAQWDETIDINLKGTFLCLQAAARIMVGQGSGVIINTSSVLGSNARPRRAAYCASKAGIILLTQCAALELGPSGVRVNAIAPGSIETPLVLSVPITPEALARKTAAIPLQRRGVPADLAGPAVFLASDEAAYITGDIMTVDGGMTAGIE